MVAAVAAAAEVAAVAAEVAAAVATAAEVAPLAAAGSVAARGARGALVAAYPGERAACANAQLLAAPARAPKRPARRGVPHQPAPHA